MYQVLVPIGSVFAGLFLVWLITFVIAPYKQRNEARAEAERLESQAVRLQGESTQPRRQRNRLVREGSMIVEYYGDTTTVIRRTPIAPGAEFLGYVDAESDQDYRLDARSCAELALCRGCARKSKTLSSESLGLRFWPYWLGSAP